MREAEYYRERADECRTIALLHDDLECRAYWASCAVVYDRMVLQVAWIRDTREELQKMLDR